MPTSQLLHGAHVRLTALNEDDLPTLSAWYEDVEFARLIDAVPALPKPLPDWREWLDESRKAQNGFVLAIRRQDDNLLLGHLEINDILWPHGAAWLGIGIGDRAHWGQGYGSEALQLALKFAFHELNLYRVQATVFEYNSRSQAMFKKAGFQQEGSFREFLNRDGQRYDMLLYGLLRREWEATLKSENSE